MARINLTNEVKATAVASLKLVSATAEVLSDKAPELIGKSIDLVSNVVDMGLRITAYSDVDKLEDQIELAELQAELNKIQGKSQPEPEVKAQ